jgi:thymidylate synthase
MRFNLQEEFPLVKAKFTPFRLVANELLWFLSGSDNISYLLENNNHIWDEWADEAGNLGPVYGVQWRKWKKYEVIDFAEGKTIEHLDDKATTLFDAKVRITEIDQIKRLIKSIKSNPSDRRLIVSPWNVSDLDQMALPPCHCFFQFHVTPSGKLSCQLYQRSADIALGVPFNIASYALLTHMIAHVCDLEVGELVHTLGDAHIYGDHFAGVEEMLSRPIINTKAKLIINRKVEDIDDFKMEDFEVQNYQYHKKIQFSVAI